MANDDLVPNQWVSMVREFMGRGNQDMPAELTVPGELVQELRWSLISEETDEYGLGVADFANLLSRKRLELTGLELPGTPEGQFLDLLQGMSLGDQENLWSSFAKVADAIGDILYVTIGTAIAWGLPMEEIFAEIHRTNMEKVKAKALVNGLGKVGKPEGWSEPKLVEILKAHQGQKKENQ
jgi:hypothetical protein